MTCKPSVVFTFHYVSIKSQVLFGGLTSIMYLHSTMYLLNREREIIKNELAKNLHSTMYLLNLICCSS